MKIKSKLIGAVCSLCFSASMFAQTTWYFGNAGGLKFTGGVPGIIAGDAMNTGEGSAVLVNDANNVVMYTDGAKLWNGANTPQMGGGVVFNGHPSSTQTALIVPIPGLECSKAFVFTVNAAELGYGNGDNTRNNVRVSLVSYSGTAPATTISCPAVDLNQH